MIEVQRVRFSYRGAPVLRDISLRWRGGELCAIVGPNGCGKTTLLRLLSRLYAPDEGRILLEGRPFSEYVRRDFAQKVALMPQTRPVPEMCVQEFVAHGRYPYLGFSQKMALQDEQAVRKALCDAGAQQLAQRNLRELSGGERQRVYLALLLAQDTPVALLDEPTTYLDIATQFGVMHALCAMRQAGKCVVVVLHDLGLAMEFCDRIIVLQAGEVQADAAPQELSRSDVWERVFGIACVPLAHEGQTKYLFQPR